jgi:hypothetical protein
LAELAEAEIERWPRTGGLGMTERTRALLEELDGRAQAGQAAEPAPSGPRSRAGPLAGAVPPGTK